MSDIVIRGIEMPKDKPLNLSIYPNGEVVLFCIQGRDVYDNECNYGDYKHKKIAVELPPHGALKDEMYVLNEIDRQFGENEKTSDIAQDIQGIIMSAPTVLEASE